MGRSGPSPFSRVRWSAFDPDSIGRIPMRGDSCTSIRSLVLGLALLSGGCAIHSEVPLSDPDQATPNEKLLGKWAAPSQDDAPTFTVRKAPPGYPRGVMMLSHTDDNPGNYNLFFTTELNGQTYANLFGGPVRKPADLPPWDQARKGPFHIVKYQFAGDSVDIWEHDEKWLQESVRRGKPKGVIREPPPGTYGGPFAVLQESTADLVQFVLREDTKLFAKKGTLKRVK
jgi:hypothetical protein